MNAILVTKLMEYVKKREIKFRFQEKIISNYDF